MLDGYARLAALVLRQTVKDADEVARGRRQSFDNHHGLKNLWRMPPDEDINVFLASREFELFCDRLNTEPADMRRRIEERLCGE